MRPASLTPVVLLAVFVAGCHQESNPVTPSPPGMASPTIANLVIAGVDAVLTGSASHYSVTATMSDGTTRSVTATWSSSNTEVASVDSAGRLDGRTHGQTTLTATVDAISATKAVQVVNNYRGTWTGRYIVNVCDAPASTCVAMEYDVFSFPITLEVSQTGTDQNEISAMLVLPSFLQIRALLSGRVTSDGRLNLAGSSDLRRSGSVFATFHVGAWDTHLRGPDTMTGRWAQRLSNLQPPYDEYHEIELESMTRSGQRLR